MKKKGKEEKTVKKKKNEKWQCTVISFQENEGEALSDEIISVETMLLWSTAITITKVM